MRTRRPVGAAGPSVTADLGYLTLADRGSIVLGWLTRLVVTLGLLGVVGFEVLSVVVAHVQIQDIGQSAAQEALTTYQGSSNPALAYQSAEEYADSHGSKIPQKSFIITPQSVTFNIIKVAPTLLLYRWDKVAHYAVVETTIYAEPLEAGGSLP